MALFYQPSKATEIVLTTLFGLEVAAIFAVLLQGRHAAGCPVSSLEAAAALAGCCLLVAPMIKLCFPLLLDTRRRILSSFSARNDSHGFTRQRP